MTVVSERSIGESGATVSDLDEWRQRLVPSSQRQRGNMSRSELFERGTDIVYRQLSMMDRSRYQLKQAMLQRDIPEDIAEDVLVQIENKGLIDDANFAESVVRLSVSKGRGRRAIAQELSRKGIKGELAEAVLSGLDESEELEQAIRFAVKKLRAASGKPETLEHRTYAALARRGYSADICTQALNAAKEEMV